MKKKTRRRFVLGALALLLLGAAGVLVFRRAIFRAIAEPALRDLLRAELGLEIESAELDLGLDGSVRLRNFSSSGKDPRTPISRIGLEAIEAEVSVLSLLRDEPGWLRSVRAEGLRVVLDLDRPWPQGAGGVDRGFLDRLAQAPPAVILEGGELEITKDGETWKAAAIRFEHSERRFKLLAGGLSLPPDRQPELRVASPLEAEGALGPGREMLERFEIDTVRLGGEEVLRAAVLRLEGDAFTASGEIPGARGSFVLRATPAAAETTLRLDGAGLDDLLSPLAGAPELRGRISGEVRGEISLEDPGGWTLSGRLRAEAAGYPDAGLEVRELALDLEPLAGAIGGALAARGVRWRGSPEVGISGPFRLGGLDGGGLAIAAPGLRIESDLDHAVASISYHIAEKELALDVRATHLDLCRWREFLFPAAAPPGIEAIDRAALAGELRLRGRPGDPGSWELVSCGRARDIRSTDWLDENPEAVAALELEGGFNLRFAIESAGGACRIEELRLAGERSFLDLRGSLDATGFPDLAAALELGGRIGGRELGLERPIIFERGAAGFRLEPAAAELLGGALSLSARGDEGGRVELEFHGADLSAGALLAGLLPEARIAGSLSFEGRASCRAGAGGLADPRADLFARLDGGGFSLKGRRIEGLDVESRLEYSENLLRIEDLSLAAGKDAGRVSGIIPLPFPGTAGGATESNGSLDLCVEAAVEEFARWLPAIPQVRDAGGSLQVLAAIRGDLDAPRLQADLFLDNARLRLEGAVEPVTRVRGRLRLDGTALEVRELRGDYGGAPVEARGAVHLGLRRGLEGLDVQQVDLAISGKDLPLRRTPDLRARGDADLRLSGPPHSLLLAGEIEVRRVLYFQDYRIAFARNPLPFTLFSVKEEPFRATRLDIAVRSGRVMLIRNNLLRTRAALDLVLGGTAETPVLTGRIFTDEGRVRLPTTSLAIDSAMIEFAESEPYNPRVQVSLSSRIRGYAVSVAVTGSLEQPEVLLSSTPPLEAEKVLILVTTGYTLEEISERGAERVAAIQAARYLAFQIADYFQARSGEESFLSRFSVETESAVQRDFDDLIRVEYRLTDSIFLQGERDFYGDFNLNAGYRFQAR